MQKQGSIVLIIGTTVFAWAMVTLLALYQFAVPIFFDAKYVKNGKENFFVMPLNTFNDSKVVEIEMSMHLAPLHPNVYKLVPDDCIREVWINDLLVEDERINFCDLKGREVYLGEYLRAGTNTIRISMEDFGGLVSFRMRAGDGDPFFMIVRFSILLTMSLYGLFVLRFFKAKRNVYVLFGIAVLASIFAKNYDYHIPYYNYSYDADGHIEYVKYVFTHWSIPAAQGHGARGWEFYQPPLYYFILAGLMKIGTWLGRSPALLIEDMETVSWILMTMSLGVTAWLTTLFFPKKGEHKYQYAMLAFVGFMPITIFQSSRITNDVLFYFVTLIILGFLFRWWRGGKWLDWYITVIAIGIALLIKSNAIPLILALFFCLFLRPKIRFSKKIIVGLSSILFILLIMGWYQYYRFVVEGEQGLVGNLGGLSSAMIVPNGLSNYLTFNPLQVLDIPFNNVWSDAHRRQYFLEYFVRSMHFGEFDFGYRLRAIATILLMTTLPLLVVSIIGLGRDMGRLLHGFVPVWAVGGALAAAAIGYRITAPYSCNQDFRFIAPIIVVFAFYIILGARSLPRWLESVFLQILGVCTIVASVFVYLLVQ